MCVRDCLYVYLWWIVGKCSSLLVAMETWSQVTLLQELCTSKVCNFESLDIVMDREVCHWNGSKMGAVSCMSIYITGYTPGEEKLFWRRNLS